MLERAYLLTPIFLWFALAAPAAAAPAMFEASFIFHAWGNDISTGTPSGPTQYLANDWTAAPLGYKCAHMSPYTYTPNGATQTRYCRPTQRQRGHPATGNGTLSVVSGTPSSPPTIMLATSALGVQLITDVEKNAPPYPGTTPQCCRGSFPTLYPTYVQSFTYATFANAAGTFFAGGGAAAGVGYVNKTGMTGMTAGTWRIRAGKNAFGGVMGLLGKYGATGKYTITGKEGTYSGISSWNMVKAIGRPFKNTPIGTGPMGTPLYQNPYTKTDMWYKVTHQPGSMTQTLISTITAIGTGTLWTTGQVGGFAKTGAFYTILYRTGFDNRDPVSGIGNIQLVTPTLTHWLSSAFNTHTAQIGLLTIQVPEPGAVLLLAAGAGALLVLRRVSLGR